MIESLNNFRKKAMSNRLATIWKTADELTGALAISIMRAKVEISRPGWQRATDYNEGSLRREIMELQKQNDDLLKDLDEAKNTISSFTEQTGVAFENHGVKIEYYYHSNRTKIEKTLIVGLRELFSIIATEMMDVSITESYVEKAILRSKLLSPAYDFCDRQFVKRILNQYKALNLIDSYWNKENSTLYWRLTAKGRKVRDDMILIRNT
jgi:hypothetical protein